MKTVFLQHVPFEGPAALARITAARDIPGTICRLYEGEALPEISAEDMVFLMGGPMSVHDEAQYPWLIDELRWLQKSIAGGAIVIGICLGAQLIAKALGAPVTRNRFREIGWFPVRRVNESPRVPLPRLFPAFHWHGETFGIPAGAVRLAESDACENQAFLYGDRVLALQFHLEATAESIGELSSHCGGECDEGGPYVQGVRELVRTDHIDETHLLMERVIDAMVGDA